MKRFFTFLMAILALLSISQTVKAADFYLTGSSTLEAWVKLDGKSMTDLGGERYSQEYKCTNTAQYRFRIAGGNLGYELCPNTKSYNLLDAKPSYGCFANNVSGYADNYFYVDMESGKTYTFTFDNSNQNNRTVACTVSSEGSGTVTPIEKYCSFYLIGNLHSDSEWKDGTRANLFTTFDGKTYTYTFTGVGKTVYFRVQGYDSDGNKFEKDLAPDNTEDKPLSTTFETVVYKPYNSSKAWKFNAQSDKTYTITLDYSDISKPQIKYTEGGSSVVTKEIKLLNGTSELTGSNGSYTLDLSGETSSDANITLTIDGVPYGLSTAQTISAVGTTNVDFVANATAALTLTKGFIYSLSVTEDGNMTVVAKEKGVNNGNYYLVGNFFTEDGDKINLDKKYFRFTNSKGDGTLTFDIPASLEIKAQVYASDGTCYGPANENPNLREISKTNPTATDLSVKGDLVAGTNYWTFTPRGLEETGIYTITITVDATGTPTKWDVTYNNSKRMAYFLVDPAEDHDAVVHPTYAVVKEDRSCSNNFFGNIYLEAGKHCFVVGNLMNGYNDEVTGHPVKTTNKLYLQGNGGLDPTMNIDGEEKAKHTNVLPSKKEGFTYNETKLMLLEYSPTRGNGDNARLPENHGICGEILKSSSQITDKPITSVQIVGNGVIGSWKLEDAKNMTYNKKLDCWEYTFTTDKSESAGNKFRFIANGSWEYNWGENSTEPGEQARTPYTDTTKPGREASLKEPNELGFTKNGTERGGDGTYGDMIFNRPAGKWTIRFYIRTESENGGNDYKAVYAYTITGSESKDIDLTYRKDKFIRTYSNDKPMNPVDDNVKIYEVYRYEKPVGGDANNIYARGTVYLRRLKYVPANVGVVLIGEAPAGGPYTDGQKVAFSLLERTEKSVEPGGDYREVWTKSDDYIAAGNQWNNYLVPTITAVNELGNAKVESGKITYRYFGLGNYYSTKYHTSLGNADTQEDYIGFFRLTANGRSGANKAYLSIPANAEVGNGVGDTYGFIDYNGQLLGNKYEDDISPVQLAKMALVFDDLVDGNETTGIKELETKKMNNNKYYNLQGIEIAHPVKGIYIHNGKKVIVK